MPNGKFSSHRGLKICCGVTSISLIIIAVIFTSLALTIFKPKQPEIIAHPIGLDNFQDGNMTLNVTLSMVITVQNPNYGSFKFRNSTGYVTYHGEVVGEVPMEGDFVPAHSKINIITSAYLMADKFITNPYFFNDLVAGSLNLTSTAVLHGKLSVFKILKLHATTYSICDISICIEKQDIQSSCKSKIKL